MPKKGKSMEKEMRSNGKRKEWRVPGFGCFWSDENVLKLDSDDDCMTHESTENHGNACSKNISDSLFIEAKSDQ